MIKTFLQRIFSMALPNVLRQSNKSLLLPPYLMPYRFCYDIKRNCSTIGGNDGKVDKSVPPLIYIEHPGRYLKNKVDLLRLKLFWDKSFDQRQFAHGTKQAIVLLTDLIRTQNAIEMNNFTTPLGFRQIARDMILSRDDPRLQLLKLRLEDIKRAIPAKIHFIKLKDGNHCVIDMFFASMRNINDCEPLEQHEMWELVRQYDRINEISEDKNEQKCPRRIVFAEIMARFYRDYSSEKTSDWIVAFYKVATFDVLRYHR